MNDMENQVTEPDRTKTREKVSLGSVFQERKFKISLYLNAVSAAAPPDRSPALSVHGIRLWESPGKHSSWQNTA